MTTSPGTTFPGGLTELEFVDTYRRHTVVRPQIMADLALRALAFADTSERVTLSGIIAQQMAEAGRRLVAVFQALGDRRYSVGRTLLGDLPGVHEWRAFAHAAATWTPEQMLRELSLGEDALPAAKRLRSQPDLPDLTSLVEAAGAPAPLILAPKPGSDECWIAALDAEGEPSTASIGVEMADGAALGDVTAELCAIAGAFLESYLAGRRSAGWRGGA